MLHRIDDNIRLDGYEVLRRKDITAVETKFGKKEFLERAAELKHFAPRKPEGVDLSSIPGLLTTAQEHFPLLVIHRELVAPSECEIGRLKMSSDGAYVLNWISPEATWEPDARRFQFEDVTRVGFGAEYEMTLALVAGAAV